MAKICNLDKDKFTWTSVSRSLYIRRYFFYQQHDTKKKNTQIYENKKNTQMYEKKENINNFKNSEENNLRKKNILTRENY